MSAGAGGVVLQVSLSSRLGRFFERGLFSVMGPPQLGDLSAPVRELSTRPVDVCGRCGGDRDDHEVVRSASLTYTRCPADDPA